MALLVPVHIAASNSLANYLKALMPDVVIDSTWPDPDKSIPVKAITIIPAGPRNLLYMDSPQLISTVGVSPNITYKWRVAECEQPFQLDVWSQFAADRDDMVARLDQFINVGFSALSNSTFSTAKIDQNISLELADGWQGSNAYFAFDSVIYDDTPDQAARREYRATYRGNGFFNLSNTAVLPNIAKINIKMMINSESTVNTFSTTKLSVLGIESISTISPSSGLTTGG